MRVSGKHLKGIWKTSGRHLHLDGIWETFGNHLGGIWEPVGRHLGGTCEGNWVSSGGQGGLAVIWKEFDRKSKEVHRKKSNYYGHRRIS